MFKDLAQRAEKLMNRSGSAYALGTLSLDDYREAARLMGSLTNYAELQSSYPTHLYEEVVADEDLYKMNLYHMWYERLGDISRPTIV